MLQWRSHDSRNHHQIWDLVEAGESYASIAKMIGSRLTTVRDLAAMRMTVSDRSRRSLAPRGDSAYVS